MALVWVVASALLGVGSAAGQRVDPLSLPPRQWAADAAANEVKVIQYGLPYLRYRIHTQDAKGNLVRDTIESKDGTVARLIFKENRSLTPQEDADEHARLQAMLDDPAAYARHVKNDASGKKMAVELIRMLPDAMLFTYTAGQPQRPNHPADAPAEVVMDYAPNPAWKPPTMASEGLTGLKGRVWIDPRTHYLTRMEGTIFQVINVGLGVLVHIYPGGQLAFEQAEPVKNRWIFSHFSEHVTARALMLKTYKENNEIDGAQFTAIEPMTYQEAIRQLLSTPLPKS